MTKQNQEIVNEIVDKYKEDKNVLGVAIFGSVAKGESDKYSDVDIYIILKKLGKFSRINYIKNAVRVDIILSTFKETNAYLESDKYSLKRITSDMLADGIILFDRKNILKNAIKTAKNNLRQKTKYSKEEVSMHKYSIDDFLGETQRDVGNNDHLAFGIDSQLLINNVLEFFLKINGYTLPQPKKINSLLNKLDDRLAILVSDFYREGSLELKEVILAKIVDYIYEVSGGHLPDKWHIKS
jgi:predicted nucleotidyltransferase